MFRNEIDHRFTAKVAEYISKGYRIHTSSMSGSQGEIAKVDLTNEKETVRILLNIEHKAFTGTEISLSVGRVSDEFTLNTDRVIWNGKLDIIEETKWVRITENYFVSPDEFIEIRKKRHERFESRRISDKRVFTEGAKVIALNYVKKQPRCKTVKLADIDRVFKERVWHPLSGTYSIRYIVIAKNTTFTLK